VKEIPSKNLSFIESSKCACVREKAGGGGGSLFVSGVSYVFVSNLTQKNSSLFLCFLKRTAQLRYNFFFFERFEKDFDFVFEALSQPFSTSSGETTTRREASLKWLSHSPAPPPPPLEQLGYLHTPHHLNRIGNNVDRKLGVGDHVDRSKWQSFTPADCMN
jgi:hypothetical protein